MLAMYPDVRRPYSEIGGFEVISRAIFDVRYVNFEVSKVQRLSAVKLIDRPTRKNRIVWTKMPIYSPLFALKDASLLHEDSYRHGQWITAKSGKRFDVLDPGSDEVWASCPDNCDEDVDAAIQSSHEAFKRYSTLSPRKRAQLLLSWYELCSEARDDLATILTFETGKPKSESYGEIDYSLGFLWWFSGEAERIQGSIATPSTPGRRTLVIKQPLGVAAALVPWNFPIAMVLRKAGAALAAGCTMLVKPSPETPITCLALAHLATKAGFPDGCLNVLTTSLDNTPILSQAMCTHPLVKKVSFTGSTRVGKIVAGLCALNLKKCTLELGGNCPFVIFNDADLQHALGQLMALKWRHAGQACITANRVYVQDGVYEKFLVLLRDQTARLVVGHGNDEKTTMGPVSTPRGLSKAEKQVEDALALGARRVLGSGKASPTRGYFFEPVILADMTPDMILAQEETFAPVLGVFKFNSEDEVVRLANDTSMGLASYVFTRDVGRLWRMFESLEAGMVGLVCLSQTHERFIC
jgi:succinate-semialdehyde dehydrogenase / glutarate-semialdehyde dehydrogenase